MRGCNGGTIIGRGVRVESNYIYTSQLNVTLSSTIEKSIECIYINGSTTVIGVLPVGIMTGNY